MKTYQLSITGEELGYLAIHIERLRLASEHMEKGE
jgi:beta-glucoside operon transcriptional antiterminator